MAIVFGKASAKGSVSVVDAVFNRDVAVFSETEGDAPRTTGSIRVIQDYRGHTKAGPGRKNPMLGQTVIDLSALGMLPLSELPRAIERLTALQAELAATFNDESVLDEVLAG